MSEDDKEYVEHIPPEDKEPLEFLRPDQATHNPVPEISKAQILDRAKKRLANKDLRSPLLDGKEHYPNSKPNSSKLSLNGERLDLFLELVRLYGNTSEACRKLGVSIFTMKSMQKEFPKFAEAIEENRAYFRASLEVEAISRAREGYDEPIFYQGEHVGNKRVYSDRLMEKLLEGNFQDKYGRKKDVGMAPIQINLQTYIESNNGTNPDNITTSVDTKEIPNSSVAIPGTGGEREPSEPESDTPLA